MNETKNTSSFTDEALTVSSFSNESNPTLTPGATFDHALFDESQFDTVLDQTGSPFTNEIKNT